jgi:hypothetical protein
VSGELTPRGFRMSDADRERIVAHLQAAVGEGRLSIVEFQERVDGVLQARTYGEVEPYLADLPAPPLPPAVQKDVIELHSSATSIKRKGRWNVPRRLLIRNTAGSVKLDFTEAFIASPVVEIDLNVTAGSTTLVLPAGATVDADNVRMAAGGMHVRGFPSDPGAGSGPHFVVTGNQRAGGLTIRAQRQFWGWRW